MKLRTKCSNCGHEYIVDSSVIGLTLRCRHCNKEFTAPKISPESSQPISSGSREVFDSSSKVASSTRPNFVFNQQPSTVSSYLEKNKKQKTTVNHHRIVHALEWISNFIDFKVMIMPEVIKLSFFSVFLTGSYVALKYPFESPDKNRIEQIELCGIVLFGVIPLWGVILHSFYEWFIIPFSIWNALIDIHKKLDEKTKS